MRDFILRRLLLLPLIMLAVSFLTFMMFRVVIPGDAAVIKCGFTCPPEQVELIREQLHLNDPWYEQYGRWLWGLLHGDLGESFFTTLPVTQEMGRRLPVTTELLIMTTLFSLLIGIPAGVVSAIRPNTWFDWLARVLSVAWLSIPGFWLGILVVIFGVIWFDWAPPQFSRGYVPFFDDPWVNLQQFFFPSLVMALGIGAGIMRLTRSSLLEVLRNDYIRTAWSKGLRERTVVTRHALKNALIPVTTVVGLQIGALLGGTVVMESVFNLNGMGKYVLEAIILRDILVVQGVVLFFAAAHVIANLAVDVAYAWLDPRIRYA
jgi:peptide/nickel transport system permease protein